MASFFSFLPTFPSFPLPSLPQSLQRRLLSFLLRKSLGSFVKGGLDPEAIQADLSKGTVRVATLELENQAIERLLADYPSLSFESGTIGLVTAQVTWPLSLCSTLSVDVDDLYVAFTLSRNDSSNGDLDSSVDSLATETADHDAGGMGGSILSVAVASEFVKEEMSTDEDAELRESFHLDSASTDADGLPGAFASSRRAYGSQSDMGDDEEVTMLAGIIERLVARLSFRVRRIRVRLMYESEGGGEAELELRVEEVRYADETGANQEQSTDRVFRITSPSIHLRTPTLAKSTLSQSTESLSSSDSSSAASDMMMSQSIADLRTSTASMYASATGGLGTLDEDQASEDDSPPGPAPSDPHCQICHFGTDEIVLSVSTSRSTTTRKDSKISFTLSLPQSVTLVLLPQQIRLLLEISQQLVIPRAPAVSAPSPPASRVSVTGTVSLHGVNCLVAYEETSTAIISSLSPSFWQQPLPQHLTVSHLRLRLDSIALVVDSTESTFSIDSCAITEHLRSISGTRSLPIVVSDPTMVPQSSGLSSFESTDWVMDKAGEARGWRTKLTKVRRGPSLDLPPGIRSIMLRLRKTGTSLRLAPMHLFLDLTIIPRLSPFLASLPLPQSEPIISRPSTPRPRTPRSPAPLSPLRAATFSYQQAEPTELGPPSVNVECGLIRIEVRCPPPTDKRRHRVPWMEPARSGILLLDVVGLSLSSMNSKGDEGGTKACWDQAAFCVVPANSKRATGFLSISALSPDDDESLPPFRPTICVTKLSSPDPPASRDALHSTTSVDCRLPLIQSALDKPTLDGLQLFADDLTQWGVVASRDDFSGGSSSGSNTPNPRIVGSRYFGAKSFARRRAGSESDEGSTIEGPRSMTMKVVVSDIVVDLFPARKDLATPRHLRALVSDVQLQVDLLKNSKNDMHVEATAVDVRLEDTTVEDSPIVIFSRTTPRNLTSGSQPLLNINFTSAVEKETGRKESKVNLEFSNFVYHLTTDLAWIDEIVLFAKAPPGAFETVVPNELTRIRLRLNDATVYITPSTLPSRLVLSLAHADISTDIMPDMPRTLTTVKLNDLQVLAIDDERVLSEGSASASTSEELWLSRGFIPLVQVKLSSVMVRQGNGLVLPDLELLASDTSINVLICADSVATISALLSDLSPVKPSSKSPRQSQRSLRHSAAPPKSKDMLSSVDQDAFSQARSFESHPEYLDDDVPTNLDYLADALRSSESTESASPTSPVQGVIISSIDGETIRMLDPRGIQIFDDFLAFPRTDSAEAIESSQASVIRCRLSNCDVTIHLHEGYDWLSTRKAIEEEARLVRRRLERIRQLLSSGQAHDASADDASTMLFGSIQLGLPPGAVDLPPAQLLAAINEELNEASDTVSNASSWQPLSAQASPSRKSTTTAVTRKQRKLTRSRSYAMEFNLRGIEASFDTYPDGKQLASRTRVDFESFDIIDNIRSSTWRKFLTELRASDGGVARSSGASMVRFEMKSVRPTGNAPEQSNEILVKLKISPLRLYIDQDALDFLKAFGAFHLPLTSGSPAQPSSVESGPFFQRFEILPVKIKLDYKPKRVDYHALRRGELAEMMNFFHFDGSEMTLRHLVLTGVTGSSRLSDLIQDIWTPDVKANQLADVISGIAPVRSVVNVGSGLANLVLLPIEQYRKDGRIGRGIQRGVTSFATTTTLEALNIGAKLSKGTQVILEQAEVVLGAKASNKGAINAVGNEQEVSMDASQADLISRYAEQPVDLREGIESAYRSLGDNLTSAAQTILAVPMEVYERSGTDGPVRAVVRAVPLAIIKPLIGVSEGFAYTLLGLRNSLDPDSQAEAEDKYKSRQH